jgi:hypothetical protein
VVIGSEESSDLGEDEDEDELPVELGKSLIKRTSFTGSDMDQDPSVHTQLSSNL